MFTGLIPRDRAQCHTYRSGKRLNTTIMDSEVGRIARRNGQSGPSVVRGTSFVLTSDAESNTTSMPEFRLTEISTPDPVRLVDEKGFENDLS